MLNDRNVLPRMLPPNTVCLTFDDGPGPNTLPIARFLNEHRMPSTFFFVGKFVEQNPDVVREVRELGHCVANHTFNHFGVLRNRLTSEAIVRQIEQTDRLIAEAVGEGPFLFRAPYFEWTPIAARGVNRVAALQKYIGPIWAHIDHRDHAIESECRFEACRQEYLTDIEARGGGIVLLHDHCADPDEVADVRRKNNRSLDLVKWLVPHLEGKYRCISLDQICTEFPTPDPRLPQ